MMVPKNEVWIRKVSETKAYRAGRVPESNGWSARMVPESDGWSARMVPESERCRKTRLGVLEGYRKAMLGMEGWSPESEVLNVGISAGRYLWTDPWI